MAASTRSLGMLTLFAFCMQRRRAGLVLGSGPPAFTAMAISFPMRVNCFAMRSQRANMVDFRTSNMRPIIFIQRFMYLFVHYHLSIAALLRAQKYNYINKKSCHSKAAFFILFIKFYRGFNESTGSLGFTTIPFCSLLFTLP